MTRLNCAVTAALIFLSWHVNVCLPFSTKEVGNPGQCVKLSNATETLQLAAMMKEICPSFAKAYISAEAIYLPVGIDDRANAMGTVRRVLEERISPVRQELSYLNKTRDVLASFIAESTWNAPPVQDLSFRFEILVCSELVPVCQRNMNKSMNNLNCSNLQSSAAAYEDCTAKRIESASTLDNVSFSVVPSCPWLCAGVQKVLKGMSQLATSPSNLSQSSQYRFLSRIASSCDNATNQDGNHGGYLCMDASTSNIRGRPEAKVLNISATESNFFRDNRSTCPSTRCGPGFIATNISSHWNADIQESLQRAVVAAQIVLRVDRRTIPFNGALKPCALGCKSLVYTKEDVKRVGDFLLPMLQIAFVSTVFALASFIVQWQRMRRYPMPVLFCMNLSLMFSTAAFSLRFYLPNGGKSLICHSDNSLRINEPHDGGGGSTLCAIQFSVSYFFLNAGCMWWVCFAHSWMLAFSKLVRKDSSQKVISEERLMLVYHLVSWVPSMVLVVICLAQKKVTGSPLYGFCFLGGYDYIYYLILPQVVPLIAGSVFMIIGLQSLLKAWQLIKKSWNDGARVARSKSDKGLTFDTHRYLIQMPLFIVSSLLFISAQLSIAAYEVFESDLWKRQFKQWATCMQTSCGSVDQCPSLPRGNANIIIVKVIALTVASWLTCTWALLSRDTWRTWYRLLGFQQCADAGRRRRQRMNQKVTLSDLVPCSSEVEVIPSHSSTTSITGIQIDPLNIDDSFLPSHLEQNDGWAI